MPDPQPKQPKTGALPPVLYLGLAVVLAVVALAWIGPGTAAVASSGAAQEASADGDRAPVILYMTEWCGWCRKTARLLTELEVEFEEVDIERSSRGRKEYEEKAGGRRGVPLTDIGGSLVRGYDERRIRRLVSELE